MKIGIIREGKVPPDSRVPLTPQQCAYIMDKYPVQIKVQSSTGRCYSDQEYLEEGVIVTDDVADCPILMGVKEVPIKQLISNKTYLFFSHTIKKQEYNRGLLKAILNKEIQLIDYETLTNDKGQRLIAFGKFAGMVGAHNGVMTYGLRTGLFDLKRMKDCRDYEEAKSVYKKIQLPIFKTVVSGNGRVASGAIEVLEDMGIKRVTPSKFLNNEFKEPVYTQLFGKDYLAHNETGRYNQRDFYKNPKDYHSKFAPFTKAADLMINGIYWDNQAPVFFTKEEMRAKDFSIQVIADVTCDIAPVSSIPSTLFATTIKEPIFGYDVVTGKATDPFQPNTVDMMTIDNLPNELPRDASQAFGEQFIESVLTELLEKEDSKVIHRATIAKNGAIGSKFNYLEKWVNS